MPYANTEPTKMYNFVNEEYVDLLTDIVLFFKDRRYLGTADTIIRFDEETSQYVGSVYCFEQKYISLFSKDKK
jgi:hypothetical protein